MNGEIYFNMTETDYPKSGSNSFILKRWKKHTIYSKSGSYIRDTFIKSGSFGWNGKENITASIRTTNPTIGTYFRENNPPSENLYQTNSIYLYDYVVVSDKFYYNNVYTASVVDTTASFDSDWVSGDVNTSYWNHRAGTFKNTPNSTRNNFQLTYNPTLSLVYTHRYYADPYVFTDNGEYFELVIGYPRNHFSHKRELFGLYRIQTFGKINGVITTGTYRRNSQTITTTIGPSGLEDGSSPVQSTLVGNLNLVKTDNVINQ